jgi:LuxR family maltose regulon positive regulatory protein
METGESLLLTKLFAPQVRPSCVARPALVARLNQALGGKLTLISAPAGFGKTTLVGEWLQQVDRPFAWLSLDDGDNDPNRFLTYLTGALQRIHSSWSQTVQELLRSPQPPGLRAMVVALINEIATGDSPFVLILDDYHLVSTPSIHDAFSFLLDNLPPQMHLLLLGRADPPFSLARLRASGELTEIRADDLRFTLEEATAFLNEVMNLDLAPQQIAILESRTEGWVAGLQLAGLSLQGLARGDVAGFIEAFAGSHRYVMDYLMEEVFGRQPPRVRGFLLQTSILDRLCGPLCDAVTSRDDGQAMLEWLDAANLFIVPLDHERRWYRYHHLFSGLLRDRLHETQPGRMPELRRRAAEWCESDGLIEDAVRYALQAQDHGLATRLIEQALCRLYTRNETLTITGWMRALPRELVFSQPRLCLSYAGSLAASGDLDAAARLIEIAEDRLQASPPSDRELPSVVSCPHQAETHCAGECYATSRGTTAYLEMLKALIACYRSPSKAADMGQRALDQIPPHFMRLRGLALLILGEARFLDGSGDAADSTLSEALEINRASNHTAAFLTSSHFLACLRVLQGRLREAKQIYQDGIRFAAQQAGEVYVGIEHVGLADLLREWNDLDAAAHHLQEGLRLAGMGGDLMFLRDGYLAEARLAQARGDFDEALNAAHKALEVIRHHRSAWETRWVEAWRARLWLAQGNLAAAAQWARACGLGFEDELSFTHEFGNLVLARVLLAQHRLAEARHLLDRLLTRTSADGRTGRSIEVLVVQALTHQAGGNPTGALASLERAMVLAEPEGYVRIFVDEGLPMAILLHRARARGIAPDYARRLLAAVETPAGSQTPPGQPFLEPLTAREVEVLGLIAAGLRNQDIADQLVISRATVKRHISNIYAKLGVSRRIQAVAQAQELGLL